MEQAITFTAKETAELLPTEPANAGPEEIAGSTVVSLISAGTEVEGQYRGQKFPCHPGYAAIIEAQSAGEKVSGDVKGKRFFCMRGHRSSHSVNIRDAVPVPEGLSAEEAVFARMMCVSMSTLTTTTARPGDQVLVTGLGLVGNLAAQMFQSCGYEVIACDPSEARRESAKLVGITRVAASIPLDDAQIKGKIALHVEASGHEQAVIDGCKVVRKRGEVVMVGVPWRRRSDAFAFDLLHPIFHNYVVLRSGWEWELPNHPQEFRTRSIFENFATALHWLAQRRVKVDGLYACYSPRDCQRVYQDVLNQRTPRPGIVFDWREMK